VGLETVPVLYRGPLSDVFSPDPQMTSLEEAAIRLSRFLYRWKLTGLGRWVEDRAKARHVTRLKLPRPEPVRPLAAFAEGKTTMPNADHVREGFVIRPTRYFYSRALQGRAILKLQGEGYLTRKSK
jgi:hypothetical protein